MKPGEHATDFSILYQFVVNLAVTCFDFCLIVVQCWNTFDMAVADDKTQEVVNLPCLKLASFCAVANEGVSRLWTHTCCTDIVAAG
jgi:hypothetical protein